MSEQSHPAFEEGSEQVDTRALTQQLGSAEELTTLSPHAFSQHLTRIHSLPALRDFLFDYRDKTLALHEFNHIYSAWSHASRNELRELIELDRTIPVDPAWKPFMAASHNVGKRQLNKMRLLKDDRFIQRYRKAVLDGQAYAWHTIVYGIVLATYSIPLRQGLLHYGRKTIAGFISNAARSLDLTEDSCSELHTEVYLSLPPRRRRNAALEERGGDQAFELILCAPSIDGLFPCWPWPKCLSRPAKNSGTFPTLASSSPRLRGKARALFFCLKP